MLNIVFLLFGRVYLGDFLSRIFGRDESNKKYFFAAVEKTANNILHEKWTVDYRKPYLHQPSAASAFTSEMKGRFSKEYSIVQSMEVGNSTDGNSDDEKKPAADLKMPSLPSLPTAGED